MKKIVMWLAIFSMLFSMVACSKSMQDTEKTTIESKPTTSPVLPSSTKPSSTAPMTLPEATVTMPTEPTVLTEPPMSTIAPIEGDMYWGISAGKTFQIKVNGEFPTIPVPMYTIELTADGRFNSWGDIFESTNYVGTWTLVEDMLILQSTWVNSNGEEIAYCSYLRYVHSENMEDSILIFLDQSENEIGSLRFVEDGTVFYLRYIGKFE